MKRLLASAILVASIIPASAADNVTVKMYRTRPAPVVVQQPAPLTGIPIVGTVVQGSLRFAETLIYAPFELLGYRR